MTISEAEMGGGDRQRGAGNGANIALPPPDSRFSQLPRAERITVLALAAVALAMRAVAFFHYRFDSDEPQHLHVAWGWTVGLLPYRDLFDNHAPLFHMAAAPWLRLFGVRPDILLFMRAPMIPLWILVTVAAFALARRMYGVRVAVWSTLLLNVFPPFFLKSLEFRTDNLWNACWMVAVAALTLGPRSVPLFFLAGLLLGCALAISLKTSLLLFTLAGAGAVTWFMRLRGRGVGIRATHFAALASGIVIVPSMIAAYFVARGAWANLVYCVFGFNEMVALTRSRLIIWAPRVAYLPLMVIMLRVFRRYRLRTTPRRFFFAVATAIFVVTLLCFWILISPRDFLPFIPFAAIFVVAPLARRKHFVRVVGALTVVCLLSIGYYTEWLANRTRELITAERQLLRLTAPGDLVMDYKGETIYRRRPYYFILEFITRNAIVRGLIKDTIPEDLVRSGCHVAEADGPQWPDRARDFMNANFIDVGRLRTSGQWLRPDGVFTIAIPGDYVVLARQGEAEGSLDGAPYLGPRRLASGLHTFRGARGGERLAFLWAPAYARGFSPFHPRDLDF